MNKKNENNESDSLINKLFKGNAKIDSVVFLLLLHVAVFTALYSIHMYGKLWWQEYQTRNIFRAVVVYAYVILLILIMWKIEDEILFRKIKCKFVGKVFLVTDIISAFFLGQFFISWLYSWLYIIITDTFKGIQYSEYYYSGGRYNTFFCALLAGTVSIMNSVRSKTKLAKMSKNAGLFILLGFVSYICFIYILQLFFGVITIGGLIGVAIILFLGIKIINKVDFTDKKP